MRNKISYGDIYDYSRLERAVRNLHLQETEEMEARLLNLHNHLVWCSYTEGKDPVADAILLSALMDLLEESNLETSELPTEFRNLCTEGRR